MQQGFLAEANALRRAVGVKPAVRQKGTAVKSATHKEQGAAAGEQDLLAQFLLENL